MYNLQSQKLYFSDVCCKEKLFAELGDFADRCWYLDCSRDGLKQVGENVSKCDFERLTSEPIFLETWDTPPT
jgi:hypothetical protein